MSRIYKIVLGLLIFPLLLAMENALERSVLAVKLEDSSYIIIHGATNINQFECNYATLNTEDTIHVQVDKLQGKVFFDQTKLEIRTTSFDCGSRLMNRDFEELLSADQFPYIDIKLNSVTVYDEGQARVKADVLIQGKRNTYEIPVAYQILAENQIYQGVLSLNIRDFEIEPPKKMLGMVTVDEMINIEFGLVVKVETT
ncbi:MAG: YceI family protein [Saprospiraceae bacterium]|nr:YceI family protein [Saprospiraceae bacterium]